MSQPQIYCDECGDREGQRCRVYTRSRTRKVCVCRCLTSEDVTKAKADRKSSFDHNEKQRAGYVASLLESGFYIDTSNRP